MGSQGSSIILNPACAQGKHALPPLLHLLYWNQREAFHSTDLGGEGVHDSRHAYMFECADAYMFECADAGEVNVTRMWQGRPAVGWPTKMSGKDMTTVKEYSQSS